MQGLTPLSAARAPRWAGNLVTPRECRSYGCRVRDPRSPRALRTHLARLHMLGRCPAGEPLPPGLADDVSEMTSAILAEADAALRAAVAAVPGARRRAVAGFLADRVTRLAATADEAVSAAKDGDAAAARRCLRRFEVLTSAVWTAQFAMPDEAKPLQPTRRPRRPKGRVIACQAGVGLDGAPDAGL